MTSLEDLQATAESGLHRVDTAPAGLLPLYSVTLFFSALLMFWVQPLFAKMVLPLLGGAAGVWNTVMLFFQAVLLAGYLYAHFVVRLLSPRQMVGLHLVVLAAALVSLPLGVSSLPAVPGAPALWLMGLLALSVGLPFFAVSTTAPLLQRWFAHSGHSHAADPYFLYGASNVGSILALLAFPFLMEPLLRVNQQSWAWTGGYLLLLVLILTCGLRVFWSSGSRPAWTPEAAAAEPIAWRRKAHWVALAFAPSSLLLGVTAHITTDLAAMPLLWVVPLALYLLSFVLVFARRPLLRHGWMVALQPYALFVTLLLIPTVGQPEFWIAIPALLILFFVTAMVCHGELVKRRPVAGRLTEFYIWMAFGGMLGGVFNALLAPALFSGIYEYGLALMVAFMLRPGQIGGGARARVLDLVIPAALAALMFLPVALPELHPKQIGRLGPIIYVTFFFVLLFGHKDRPLRYGLGVGALLLAGTLISAGSNRVVQERSFFGVYWVMTVQQGKFQLFGHGTTVHGAQHTAPALRREPLSYYSKPGPLGRFFAAMNGGRRFKEVALVGLGIGSGLCYRTPGQAWTAYEIDPLVLRLARDTRYFHYLEECGDPATTAYVLGDARLSLQNEQDGRFDLMIFDAFSSDSVPAHLITREALALYRRKLADNGILIWNISNIMLDLERVLGPLIEDAGMVGVIRRHEPQDQFSRYRFTSVWVAAARDWSALEDLRGDPLWAPLEAQPGADLWTDDFSNILRVMR